MEWFIILPIIVFLFIRDENNLNSSMSEEAKACREIRKEHEERAKFLNKKAKEKLERKH